MGNRLASAASLYLRQHAADPVDWQPWDAAALEAARAERRPILLSVGYSACHWCHVMARESFADPTIAALVNRHFVAIKVDREERPDIDRVYQLAHQALQRRAGGWPLTVFLDPDDLLPFFVGTYFPPERRLGLPAFAEVLAGLARWYVERPDERAEQARALRGFLRDYGAEEPELGALSLQPAREAAERWLQRADPEFGGERGAPKFPQPGVLEFALAHGNPALLRHAHNTLLRMAAGGLHDQVGGGFFRYSVDPQWAIPHFEKMLVDNAQLLPLYARLAAEGEAEARRAAIGIVSWLQEEMRLAHGGYASALDADSGEEEGGFYLWQRDAAEALLPEEGRDILRRHYGLDAAANFEGRAWHLQAAVPLAELAAEVGLPLAQLHEWRKKAARRLRLARAAHPAPARDDKCLIGANGLLLSGLARAGHWLQRADWLEAAVVLASDLQRVGWRDGRLYAVAYAGQPAQAGFLDDHAALLLGLLDLVELRWRSDTLEFALDLAEALLRHFEDADFGGFWFTAHDQTGLPQRPKPALDESTPSGNGLAAMALLRLGTLVAEPRYLQAAERALRATWPTLVALPEAGASLLLALQAWRAPPPLLVARLGDTHEQARWAPVLDDLRRHGARVLQLPGEAGGLPSALEDKRWLRGGRVYWCEGLRCLPRFDSPVALEGHALRWKASRTAL